MPVWNARRVVSLPGFLPTLFDLERHILVEFLFIFAYKNSHDFAAGETL